MGKKEAQMKSYYVSKWTDEWMNVVAALPTY